MNSVISGDLLTSKDEARDLCALKCQIEYGNYNPNVQKPGFLKYVLLILWCLTFGK